MRKLTGILFLFFAFITLSQAQVNFISEDSNADKGDTLKVVVKAERFNAILSFDYRQSYDTTAFRFIDVVDKHKDLEALTFLGPKDMAQPDNFISFSWFEPTSNAITLPNTTDLYTIRFIAQGNEGDMDSIKFTSRNGPSGIEVSDVDNDPLPFTLDNGLMKINGGTTGGGKLKVFLSENTGDKGQQKCLDLSVEDFTDILDFQLAFKWDKAVATYASVSDFNLKDLSAGNFAIHPTTKELRVTWSERSGNAVTLSGKTKIASICYDLTGNAGSSTPVQIANDGSFVLEASNDDGDDVEIEVNHGKLTINQATGGGNFTLIASKEVADKNEDVCVDVSVRGFVNVAGLQFTMAWDKDIISSANIKNTNLVDLDAVGSFNIKDGSLNCSWDDKTVEGIDVADNTVIFQLCFTTSNDCDAISSVIFKDNENEKIDVFDPDLNDIAPVDLVQGEVKIECSTGGADDFDLTIKNRTVEEDKEVCVDMDVENFTDIEGMQFSLVWNPSIIMFTRINNINIPGFNASSYSENPVGSLRVAFSPVNPVTIADGTMFEVCFTGLDCDKSSNLTFSNSPLGIEASNSVEDLNVVTHNGSINVTCKTITDLTVVVQGKKNIRCFGDENGSIGIQVSGATAYTYQWYKNGVAIPGPDGTKKNLTNIGPGEYYVVVTDANDVTRTVTLTPCSLDNISKLVINEVANTRDDGTCNGSVEVLASGGWGNYSYVWISSPQPQQRTPKLSNACKGNMHIVQVIDAEQCNIKDTFTIFGPEIEHNASNTKLKCNGDCDAAITVAPEGGCKPYTYNWSGAGTDQTAMNQTGLCAGNYAVTISDVLGDEEVVTFTIFDPDPIVITLDGLIIHGNNGQINVIVTGGTPTYVYNWTNEAGVRVSTSKNLTGAMPGTYTLTVTDENGCTKTFSATIKDPNVDVFSVTESTTDVTCNGENDGEIDLDVENGDDCIIIWEHDPSLTDYIATNLSAGDYKVTFKDENGNDKWTKTFTILEPEALSVSVVEVKCATTDNANNGSYEVIVTGGTPNYTYDWCSGETTAIAVRLPGGKSCDVLVKDAKGCQAFYEDIEVCADSTVGPGPKSDCYEGRKVITPNEDGLNDYLLITCDNDFPNKLSVFDRWGRLVFEQIDYNSTTGLGWTGIDINGAALNEGGYMWVLRVDLPNGDQRLYRGTVILAR